MAMMESTRLPGLLGIVLVGGSLGIMGCAHTGQDRAVMATGTMREYRDLLAKGRFQVDVTVHALNRMLSQADEDPHPYLEIYRSEFGQLKSIRARAAHTADSMHSQGRAYFQAWEEEAKSFPNEALRKASTERRAKLEKLYEHLKERASDLKKKVNTFMAGLADLNKLFDIDFTADGIKAVAPQITKANEDGKKVKQAIDVMTEELVGVAAALTPKR